MTRPVRYRATLAYIGTAFHGWQRQSNAARTVQAVLEEALASLDGSPVRAVAAGRTDAGVHADGQVVHFDLTRPLEPRRVRAAANARLPPDARLLDVAPAPDGFDARRDALGKEYVYRWSRAAVIPPRDAPFVAPLSPRADARSMTAAAAPLSRDAGFRRLRGPAAARRVLRADASRDPGGGARTRDLGSLFRGMGSFAEWSGRSPAPWPTSREAVPTPTGCAGSSQRATARCSLPRLPPGG